VALKGRTIEVFTEFWLGGTKGRVNWEGHGVGGRITLRWTLGRDRGAKWIRLAHDRVHVNTVMKLRVP
jgi:hypothetical protein